ncbi:MAG TPA: hypothetical protein VHV52_14345 [Gaiellaceae bacterium]|nr:hypothetical protein [Gaiellaceae bacterium]
MGGMIGRLLANIRDGRVQKLLAATTAMSAPALGFEIYFEHYKGSFGDKWMWTPLILTPPLTAAGVAGFASEKAAKTALPLVSALYFLDGLAGVVTHVQGVRKRPGGFKEAHYNLVMGPPLLAPGSLCLVGALGIAAAIVKRER